MSTIRKRAAVVGAVVTMIATAGPITLAGASTVPTAAPAPFSLGPASGAYAAGAAAAVGGFNAGTAGAVGGWNAGAAALGLPFQFTDNAGGPFGVHTVGVAPLTP
ncbi:MAG TPA: hypothetical protein VK631_07930 [Solirubrobacteraceae bacterium]|nr:hypothetical protein [Solirubrobacteraceae bacterium]